MPSRITWDQVGTRTYETGVDQGVLYVATENQGVVSYGKAIPWNGLTAVKESTDGGDIKAMYADNMKYLELQAAEDFKLTIEAYTYPDEFMACDGTAEVSTEIGGTSTALGLFLGQQTRSKFGFSYRTRIGNDLQAEKGHKIHLVYGCLAAPSSRDYNTVNDSPEAITFSWEVSTTPPAAYGSFKPTAHVILDTTQIPAGKLTALENKLYGDSTADGCLPDIEALVTLLSTST